MTLCKLRYYFEHKFLRKYYFENTVPFLAEMFEVYGNEEDDTDNFLYNMIREAAEKNDIEFPYSKEQYKVDLYPLNEDDFMIRIRLPEAEEPLLCTHIYLLFPIEDFSKKRYFTIELVERKGKRKHYCLCEWEEDGFHANYGYLPNSIEKIEDKIISLFYKESN